MMCKSRRLHAFVNQNKKSAVSRNRLNLKHDSKAWSIYADLHRKKRMEIYS